MTGTLCESKSDAVFSFPRGKLSNYYDFFQEMLLKKKDETKVIASGVAGGDPVIIDLALRVHSQTQQRWQRLVLKRSPHYWRTTYSFPTGYELNY